MPKNPFVPSAVFALLTDFGLCDNYVGVLKELY